MSKSFDNWADEYKMYARESKAQMFPSETLVRLLKGNYIKSIDKNYKGKKAIDIGFGNGNNSIFLAGLGCSVSGTEVHGEICDIAAERMKTMGYDSDYKVGTNQNLPFEDNSFDLLISWNVIHYENTVEGMKNAISEYRRVLKPVGRFIISTTAPDHKILQNATALGENRYQIGRDDDFRKGEVYFYFNSKEDILKYFGEDFKDIEIGRTRDELISETVDFFLITGVKG